jgi:hypothetical protein
MKVETRNLFYNFERGALAMARGGAGEQRPNSVDGLPAAPDHAADIALSKLKFENIRPAARNFREHHVVGIFDQLPNDELEKFSHGDLKVFQTSSLSFARSSYGGLLAKAFGAVSPC